MAASCAISSDEPLADTTCLQLAQPTGQGHSAPDMTWDLEGFKSC
jgi:uncharacterized protein YfiM (DUF2279 family)